MKEKINELLHSENLKNFVLYGIFGVLAAMIEFGVFSALIAVKVIPEELVNVIGQLCGFAFSFTTNTFLNFKKTDKLFKRFLSYGGICLLGLAFTTVVIALLKNVVEIHALKLCCMVFVAFAQFVLNKLITYKN